MTDNASLDVFLEKWRSRWPEWQLAGVFVPAAERATAVAWFALLQEFEGVLNIAGDPTPADAKLAWWGEELRDWSRRRSRHPLGRVLEPHEAPWFELAEALPALVPMRERSHDTRAALETAEPLARAVVAVEQRLFRGAGKPHPPAAFAQAVACQMLASRRSVASVPGLEAAEKAWAQALLGQWPPHAGESVPRRLWSALARLRLERFARDGEGMQPPSNLGLLWLAWRAARA